MYLNKKPVTSLHAIEPICYDFSSPPIVSPNASGNIDEDETTNDETMDDDTMNNERMDDETMDGERNSQYQLKLFK